MAVQKSRYCKECQRKTLHQKYQWVNDGMGCLLTLLSAGLFLLLWFPCLILQIFFASWRCQVCGRKN